MKPQSSPRTITHKAALLLNKDARPFQQLMNRLSVPERFRDNFRSSVSECAAEIDCRSAEEVCRLLYHAILKSNAFAYPSAEKWCHPYLLICFLSFTGMYVAGLSFFRDSQIDTIGWRSLPSVFLGLSLCAGCFSLSTVLTIGCMDIANAFYQCQERRLVARKLYISRGFIYERLGLKAPADRQLSRSRFDRIIKKPLGRPKRQEPCCRLLPKL